LHVEREEMDFLPREVGRFQNKIWREWFAPSAPHY
jgi:hypothetical protein